MQDDTLDRASQPSMIPPASSALGGNASLFTHLSMDSFESLFNAMSLPLVAVSPDLRFVWCNKLYARMMGKSVESIFGKLLSDIHTSASMDAMLGPFNQALQGKHAKYDRRAMWRDGSFRWVRVHLAPLRNAQGTVTCVLCSITNIDDVVSAQQQASAAQSRLQSILDSVNIPISRWDRNCRLLECNEPYASNTGRPSMQLIGKTYQELFGTDAWESLTKSNFERCLSGEKVIYTQYMSHLPRPHWMRVTVVPDAQNPEDITSVYAMSVDIDDEQRAIESLRESQRRLDMFTDNIPNAMTYFDKDGVYRFVSKAFLRHFNKSADDILGHTVSAVAGEQLWQELRPHVQRALKGESVRFERHELQANGALAWTRIQYSPDIAEDGSVKGVYSVRMDITDIKQAAAALKRDADWDALTETFNRNYFNAALNDALVQAELAPFTLLYLDLDGFKQINDTLGHNVGDELLTHIAQSLKSVIDSDDILARIGGDEFAVLSFGKPGQDAQLATRLLRAANKPFRLGDLKLSLTMSIGIVPVCSRSNMDVRQLMQKADAAMYEAKRSGKNRWVSTGMTSEDFTI